MDLDPQTIISQLQAGPAGRVTALRALKNDVVGDVQKKTLWVQHGLIPHLVRLLSDVSGKSAIGRGSQQSFPVAFTDDGVKAQLQALQLLTSFANAGSAFLPPLLASGALPVVLSDPYLQNKYSEIALAALCVIKAFTVATSSASASSPISLVSLADDIFTDCYLQSLHHILSRQAWSRDTDAQITIVAFLIRNLCREERHRVILVDSGILDALATKIAAFAVAEGYVIPKAEMRARLEGLGKYIPEPPISSGGLDEVLGAVAAIITDSPFRVCKLVYSPSILAIFPNFNNSGAQSLKSPSEFIKLIVLPGRRPTRPKEPEIMDLLLPGTPSYPRVHGNSGGFASLNPQSSRESPSTNGRPSSKLQTSLVSWTPPEESITRAADAEAPDTESPLVPWLIHLVRARKRSEVVMAASVLTSLFKTGFAYKAREASMGLLVVPILLGLLEDAEAKMKEYGNNWTGRDAKERLNIIEETPAILARLITDSDHMQKAAFECGAVKTICKLLKNSYDMPLSAAESRPWSPNGTRDSVTDSLAPECRLGDDGQHPQLTHRRRVRETTLQALGALATFKEDYRKAIVDQEVVTYIIDSLKPFPGNSKQAKDLDVLHQDGSRTKTRHPEQNTVSVIVAACYAIRMMSRSVNTLRTALVDQHASEPVFNLLRHHDVEVQIAATACICNLVLDFSPMRDRLVDANVLEVLCEHAHSLNSALRLNALWALKHLVDSANIDYKKRCVEELESGWLVQLICDDTEDEALYSARARSERQSTSTTPDVMDEDVDMAHTEDQSRTWFTNALFKTMSTSPKSDIRILQLAEPLLATLKEVEQNPVRKARHDDLAIQEQGLDFIRNLIGGAHSSNSPDSTSDTAEMIDYLLNTLGQDRLFTILASKLKPKVFHPLSRRGSSNGSETRVLPPQAKIVAAVIYILVHIAASIPRHRQLVIAQTSLLTLLAKLFNSQDREVRVALCHLINNLTWQDDMSDASACSQRATELRNLGFLRKLENLNQSDDELDVRERAKCALWQMKQGC
ncbi:putative armadillo repeat protein [Rosellinia necatrix]|uniref:Putative armadillo repeat protein n=1 Tax=Rosellinia necatrix TaxID=77044 RepID=A0A1W2TNW9_ROSNE|nr:putative armadillo repeat protein [Rosellinia necatrix]